MKELFCNYCQRFRKDDGRFLMRLSRKGGRGGVPSPRRMCGQCQDVRKLPAEERQRLADLEKGQKK